VAQAELHQVVVAEVEDYFIPIVMDAHPELIFVQEYMILQLEAAVLVVTV